MMNLNLPKCDVKQYPQYNGFDPQFFFDVILPHRKKLNEKGILTCPFNYGYKLQNTEDKYGKKIYPWSAWKKGDALKSIQLPHEKKPFNYIVKTGKVNGFLVIDYDFPKHDDGEVDGLEWLRSILPEDHAFWNTKQVKTASGGTHFYLKYDERFKIGTTRCIYLNGSKSKISLDMRTDGCCVIGEYSVNEKGVYIPDDKSFEDILDIPEELVPYLTKPLPQNSNIVNPNTQVSVENLTASSNEQQITADKIKYINCLNGNEYIFGEHGLWWDLAKICATFYNFTYFLQISQNAPNFTSISDCKSKFEDAKQHPVSFGLLVNIIKEHLPIVYQEEFGYINQNIYKGDEEGFNQILYHTYKEQFKYDSTNSVWYECVEGLWFKRDKDNLVMKRLIADEMVNVFRKKEYSLAKKKLEIQQNKNISEEAKKQDLELYEKLTETIQKQIGWCRSNNKRASFVNAAKDLFYDYDFLTKLDSIEYSGHLFSFTNGYIDLNEYHDNKEIIFHRHQPENYVSMTCGYDYTPLDQLDNDIMTRLLDCVEGVIPNEEDRNYLLQSLATCLTAGNDNEIILTAYGKTGGNGKGLLLSELMCRVFGSYSGTFKTANIVGKKTIDPESPSSGLASIMNCRYVYMTEPDKNEELNNDALKLLSGGDELSYRKLHENMQKRKPAFTLFLQANHILNADSYDDAVWRRLKYMHFNQTFRADPNLDKGEKQADITLKKTFTNDIRYRQTFIHILLKHYNPLLKDTTNIKKYINEARNDCDYIQEYIDNNIEQTDDLDGRNFLWNYDQTKFITFKEIKKRFKAWYKTEFDEEDNTKPTELKNQFVAKLDNHKKTHKTKMYQEGFDNVINEIKTSTNRTKQKNWGECFIGYKFSMGIEEEEETDSDLD